MSDGEELAGQPRLFTRNFATLLVAQASFGYAFSSFFMLPKFLVTQLGAGPDEVGRVAASYSFATFAALPLMGVLVDRYGRRVFMTGGALLMAALSLAFSGVGEVGPLIYALRAGQGLAFAMVFVGGATLAVDEAPPERVGQAIALFGLTMLAMNGVAAAGVEAVAAGLGWAAAFAAAAVAACLCAALTLGLRDGVAVGSAEAPNGLWRVASRPSFVRLLAVIALVGAAMSALVNFHQPFAISLGIDTVSGFFVAYSAAAMCVRVGLGHVIDRAGRRRVAIGALCLYAIVASGMAGLAGPVGLALLGVGLGTAHGFAYPALNSLAIDGVRADERGKVMALFQGAFHVGMAGAALGFGALADSAGYPPVALGGGLCAFSGLLLLLARSRRRAGAAAVT